MAEILRARDGGELGELVSRHFRSNMSVQSRGKFQGEISSRSGSMFSSLHANYQGEISAQNFDCPQVIGFYVTETGHFSPGPMRNPETYGSNGTLIVDISRINRVRFLANTVTTFYAIPLGTITRFANRLLGPDTVVFFDALKFIPKDRPTGRRFSSALELLDRAIALRERNEITEFALLAAEESILATILYFLAGEEKAKLNENGPSAQQVVRRAAEIVAAMPAPLQVSELADQLGLSIRFLQKSFQSELSVTPHGFLKNARLAALRREVLATEAFDFREIARHWGFSNITRLAKDYSEFFGRDEWDAIKAQAAWEGAPAFRHDRKA